MKKDFISVRPLGSEKKNEPKVIGEVLNEYFRSNEPLAVAYREHTAEVEAEREAARLFENIFPNSELGVDLKLMTRQPGRMPVGVYLDGVLTRDDDYHFSFVQNASKKERVVARRNPHLYEGVYVNVVRKDDGTLYPTFNHPRYSECFTFQDFCREAAEELLAVACIVEE